MGNAHNHGLLKGDLCNRNKCKGIIDEYETDTCCSCHINPPCSHCTEDRNYCPVCDWQGKDDYIQHMNGFVIHTDSKTHNHNSWKRRELDNSKIDYHILSHTNSSQICEGVYPEGTTREDVLEQVKGTFGGRFKHFGNGKFKYVAYTD